jgi:aldehyde:ferredoxin oxidoreductase
MGSKKLKAIAVNGNGSVAVAANEDDIKEARKKHLDEIHQSIIYLSLSIGGTSGLMEFLHLTGEAPAKNWGGAALVDFADASPFYGQPMEELSDKKYGCWRCPISCGALMKGGTGNYNYDAGVHRPEYETLIGFGNLCLNNDPESVIAACDICNRHGIDTISAGTAIAFTIECYENGILTKEDTDGLEMTWGNHQSIVAMMEKLANREGFGDILADGVKVASEKIGKGSEQYAMHVGGQEPGFHDPRASVAYASGFLDATPGRHTQGNEGQIPLTGMPPVLFDHTACAGRGEIHRIAVSLNNVANSAGICMFGYIAMDASALPDFLNLVTGSNHTLNDLFKIGERIANVRQAFNIREGVTAENFKIPDRILGHPPLPDGPTAGKEVDIDVMREDYFREMGWDTETGKPSKDKLIEMGLADVAEAIW